MGSSQPLSMLGKGFGACPSEAFMPVGERECVRVEFDEGESVRLPDGSEDVGERCGSAERGGRDEGPEPDDAW